MNMLTLTHYCLAIARTSREPNYLRLGVLMSDTPNHCQEDHRYGT